MIKTYCDACGNELKAEEHERLRLRFGRVTVEVMRAVDKVWNSGHVCYACVRDAVARGTPAGKDCEPTLGHPLRDPLSAVVYGTMGPNERPGLLAALKRLRQAAKWEDDPEVLGARWQADAAIAAAERGGE
jgi:hypothetical protein